MTTSSAGSQASLSLSLRGALAALAFFGASSGALAADSRAEALLSEHASMAAELDSNAFGRSIAMRSSEAQSSVSGDIYAVVERPFAEVSARLADPERWCDVLILHLNTKSCRALPGPALAVHVGRKVEQELPETQLLTFVFRAAAHEPDYFETQLAAPSGPAGTRDYKIVLAGAPLDGGSRTFLRLRYSYGFGFAARVGMQAYLATTGSGKLGFTPGVGGTRAAIERNTMRYYLALDSYLAAPGASQAEARLASWFDATERYAKQLREVDRDAYLAMKRSELRRQAAP